MRFDWTTIAERHLDLYEELVARQRRLPVVRYARVRVDQAERARREPAAREAKRCFDGWIVGPHAPCAESIRTRSVRPTWKKTCAFSVYTSIRSTSVFVTVWKLIALLGRGGT